MGCSSSVKKTVKEQPLLFSYSETSKNSTFPSWFLNQPDELVGIGFSLYSRFNPESSFQKAFEFALEDLNSNHFCVVTIEQIKQGAIWQTNEEIGISDAYTAENVVKLDSVVINEMVYMLIGVKLSSISANVSMVSTSPPFEIPVSELIETEQKIQAHGDFANMITNPYKSWALSKQSALKRLGLYTAMKVQSVENIYNTELETVSYIKSRVAFKNVKVNSRWLESGRLHTLVDVERKNIINLTE